MISIKPEDLKSLERTLADLQGEVTIAYFTEEVACRHCRQERQLLSEMAELSHKLHLEVYNFTTDHDAARRYGIDKVPGFTLLGAEDYGVRYYGMPSDFEFKMLLEDLVRVSSGESGLTSQTKAKIAEVVRPLHLEVLTTPACPFSQGALRLAHQMAMETEPITADLVNVEDFPELVERYRVLAAPTVVVNGRYHFYEALDEPEFVGKVLEGRQDEDL